MPEEKEEKRPVVAHIMFPVRVMMLATDKSGYMPFLFSDCVAEISDDEKTKMGEVGAAMGGKLHLKVGNNTFYVKVSDMWNALVDMVKEHPELAPGVNVADLGKFEE